ncbi:MAG TPA: helix-turn-helix domain-containing protein [Dehalococcoidia bacterium]|nr:helix-turn-helix domain-containing protein [Dehalococcoidia bacterium]
MLLASARGERAPQIAHHLGCDQQTVRNAIKAFNQSGLDSLRKGSSRPHTSHAAFPVQKAEQCGPCCTRGPAPSANPPTCGPWNWPPK